MFAYFVSNNQNKNSTTATSTIKFTPTQSGTMTFDWSVASESNCDKFTIKLNDTIVTDGEGYAIESFQDNKVVIDNIALFDNVQVYLNEDIVTAS